MKCVIYQDANGEQWIRVNGVVARPLNYDRSRFAVGSTVNAAHITGTPKVGVGKDETCGRGEYLEEWDFEE